MSLGRWGRRTSLISVQCEPLPVKPAGQGPQRAPLGVMVQATPGKQKSGAHWGSGRTLRPGLCTDCIPAREEGAVRATPLSGACRDHAQTAGGRAGLSSPQLSTLVVFSAFPCASRRLPAPPARPLSLFACLLPIVSVCPPCSSACPSFTISVSPVFRISFPLSLLCSQFLFPHLFLLSRRPVSASPAALTARITLHHRVFQERDLLDLPRREDAVWLEGLRPSP